MQPNGATVLAYMLFHIATHQWSKEPLKRTGKHGLVARRVPDEDNAAKCVKDALQGVLWQNDRWCISAPFPNKYPLWIERFKGMADDEWVDVECHIINPETGEILTKE
jgi:hypothetical protein